MKFKGLLPASAPSARADGYPIGLSRNAAFRRATMLGSAITVFVVREKDDGEQFDPATDLADLILEGTSTLP